MGWARFDDRYSEHPKILAAGALAELLDMRAIIYCARNETDGHVARASLTRLATGISKPLQQAQKLVDVGRWEEAGDGWVVCDYLDYNPSRADREAERSGARERMRKARSRRSSPEQDANFARSSGNPVPSRPLGNSSRDVVPQSALGPVDDERYAAVVQRLVTKRINGIDRTKIVDLDRYTATVRQDVLKDHADTICALMFKHPEATPDQLAGAVLGEPTSLGRT